MEAELRQNGRIGFFHGEDGMAGVAVLRDGAAIGAVMVPIMAAEANPEIVVPDVC